MHRLELRNSLTGVALGVWCVLMAGGVFWIIAKSLISGEILKGPVGGLLCSGAIVLPLTVALIAVAISSIKKAMDRSVQLIIDQEGIKNRRGGDATVILWRDVRYVELRKIGANQFNQHAILIIYLTSGERTILNVAGLDQIPERISAEIKAIMHGRA